MPDPDQNGKNGGNHIPRTKRCSRRKPACNPSSHNGAKREVEQVKKRR
jgi:hypothetical protein